MILAGALRMLTHWPTGWRNEMQPDELEDESVPKEVLVEMIAAEGERDGEIHGLG